MSRRIRNIFFVQKLIKTRAPCLSDALKSDTIIRRSSNCVVQDHDIHELHDRSGSRAIAHEECALISIVMERKQRWRKMLNGDCFLLAWLLYLLENVKQVNDCLA